MNGVDFPSHSFVFFQVNVVIYFHYKLTEFKKNKIKLEKGLGMNDQL